MPQHKEFTWFSNLDAHQRQYFAFGVTAVVLILIWGKFSLAVEITSCWMAYAFTLLIFSWGAILTSHPAKIKRIAGIQDSSRTFIFLFVVGAASVSILVVIYLLRSTGNISAAKMASRVLFTIFSVIVSWWLVHTVFTLRYAHLYYYANVDSKTSKPSPGGLAFPDEKEPDYLDFAYFSFVIGMTFQVSDVEVTSRRIRRLVWLHGMISFVFNTVILALSINIISSLIQNKS